MNPIDFWFKLGAHEKNHSTLSKVLSGMSMSLTFGFKVIVVAVSGNYNSLNCLFQHIFKPAHKSQYFTWEKYITREKNANQMPVHPPPTLWSTNFPGGIMKVQGLKRSFERVAVKHEVSILWSNCHRKTSRQNCQCPGIMFQGHQIPKKRMYSDYFV